MRMILIIDTLSFMNDSAEVISTDVCIIGAGPQGLAAALHFHRIDPSTNVTVIDRSNEWLATWSCQFNRAEITTLRSPIVHHPSPDSFALDDFVKQKGFPLSGLPYNPPTSEAFLAFCNELIKEADLDLPIKAIPKSVHSDYSGITLNTSRGTIHTRHLIIASNPHQKNIPEWVKYLTGQSGLVKNGLDVDLPAIPQLEGQTITVIGGGLTAAHLSRSAAMKGAIVQLIARRPLQIRNFDTDPGWLGPKYLDGYLAESDTLKRIRIARKARGGGSIPQWMYNCLLDLKNEGAIKIFDSTEILSAKPGSPKGCLLKTENKKELYTDQVWLATGTQSCLRSMECLSPILDDIQFIDEFPVVDRSLRLGQHSIYVMGRCATFALGPAAGNLWGASRAAHRIATAITGVELISNGS